MVTLRKERGRAECAGCLWVRTSRVSGPGKSTRVRRSAPAKCHTQFECLEIRIAPETWLLRNPPWEMPVSAARHIYNSRTPIRCALSLWFDSPHPQLIENFTILFYSQEQGCLRREQGGGRGLEFQNLCAKKSPNPYFLL